MKRSHKNNLDILINNLTAEFSKIPNFDLTQNDDDGNRLFNFVITRFAEIKDFQTLYKRYFIPQTNKAIIDAKKEINSSFYRNIINISDDELSENHFDTIRLGYVGLFHKVENYTKDLLKEANLLFNDKRTGNDSIESFYKKEYNFNFCNWHSDNTMHKINWIANCVKHYGGYPKKTPKYKYLSHLAEDSKIRIIGKEFYDDIDYVINDFYKFKLSQVFALAIFKMTKDDYDESIMTDELKAKYTTLETSIRLLMK